MFIFLVGSPFYSRRVGWYSTITSLISQEAEISERSSSSHYASYRACDVVWSRIGLHWPTLKSDKEGSRESRAELWFSSCFIQYVRCGVMRILDSTDPRWILTMKRQRTKSGALVLIMSHTESAKWCDPVAISTVPLWGLSFLFLLAQESLCTLSILVFFRISFSGIWHLVFSVNT